MFRDQYCALPLPSTREAHFRHAPSGLATDCKALEFEWLCQGHSAIMKWQVITWGVKGGILCRKKSACVLGINMLIYLTYVDMWSFGSMTFVYRTNVFSMQNCCVHM